MFNQFFGQFLLQKGLLTAEQLCCVFQDEDSVRVKLGVMAIDRGWMNAAQAQEINEIQKIQDKRFGDLAISKGYLEADQVEELLQSQNQRHLSLSQAILDRGYLSLSELTPVLELYKAESAGSQDGDDFDRVAEYSMRTVVTAPEQLYVKYAGLFLRNIVRSLQVQPVVERTEKFSGQVEGWLVSQELKLGNGKLLTGLALSDETMIQVASLYSKESLSQVDELTLDATGEFLNLHNGVFSINQCNQGVETSMLPQKAEQSPALAVTDGYAISIVIPLGRLQLIVAKE